MRTCSSITWNGFSQMSCGWPEDIATGLSEHRCTLRTFIQISMVSTSQVPRLPWMSVGRTNPLRAGFFSSGASSAKNVTFTHPYNTHNWNPLHVTWPRASPKLLKFNSSRSYGRFRCAPSLSTRAHYTYLQYFSQFSARIWRGIKEFIRAQILNLKLRNTV